MFSVLVTAAWLAYAVRMLPYEQSITELKNILERRSGRPVTHREASDMAIRVIGLYEILTSDPPEKIRTPSTLPAKSENGTVDVLSDYIYGNNRNLRSQVE